MKQRITLLASGSGTNVENIYRFFEQDIEVSFAGVFTNNPKAGVIERMKPYGIEVKVFDRVSFNEGDLLKQIVKQKPNLIVLAGFLWKINTEWIQAFPNKIINIHPALLPKYGGKGMYGNFVHQAVKDHNETETGITIHYVNENYDEGAVIFQKNVRISAQDTVSSIASKVHQLEYTYYPKVIASILKKELK